MTISSTTKISVLIKANPASIDAIVSINKHFEKLRNPILRKILASRVTIADAARIGGCTVEDFFKKLIPLGFEISPETILTTTTNTNNMAEKKRPAFMATINPANTVTLDVRAELASGKDPFQIIMAAVSTLPSNHFLVIINIFEPAPLIGVLKRKGFVHYTEELQKDLFHTYFKQEEVPLNSPKEELNRQSKEPIPVKEGNNSTTPQGENDFAEMLEKFAGKMKTIDVRFLEMPLPMVTILQELDLLPNDQALFVQHKKIPQFLLPELEEMNFSWLIREDGEGDVKLLIYR